MFCVKWDGYLLLGALPMYPLQRAVSHSANQYRQRKPPPAAVKNKYGIACSAEYHSFPQHYVNQVRQFSHQFAPNICVNADASLRCAPVTPALGIINGFPDSSCLGLE